MNKILLILVLALFTTQNVGQSFYDSLRMNKQSSVFNDIDTGEYFGSAYGDIFITYDSIKDLSLDFRDCQVKLSIEKDPYEVYDNSTKKYFTTTTSGKTIVKYHIYDLDNIFVIVFNNEHYSIGVIDGASDSPIEELNFNYSKDGESEKLTLIVTDDMVLTNMRHLILSEMTYDEAKRHLKSIVVRKGSKLILTVKKMTEPNKE